MARREHTSHARIVITIASMGFFLITLDISIVNVALTQMRAELGGGTAGQQWVIDGYTLLFAALLLFAGNLSDRFGAKKGPRDRNPRVRARVGRVCGCPHDRSVDRRPLRPGHRRGNCPAGGAVAGSSVSLSEACSPQLTGDGSHRNPPGRGPAERAGTSSAVFNTSDRSAAQSPLPTSAP